MWKEWYDVLSAAARPSSEGGLYEVDLVLPLSKAGHHESASTCWWRWIRPRAGNIHGEILKRGIQILLFIPRLRSPNYGR